MRTWIRRSIYLGLIFSLVVFSHEASSEITTVGNTSLVVKTVTGTVSTRKRNLRLKDDIYHNEIIQTFQESATKITFLDKTELSLGPNTSVTLDRFVYDPNPAKSQFSLTLARGAVRFVSGVLPTKNYKLKTPVATIGIRGTVVDLVVDRESKADGTVRTNVYLTVVEGEADFINCKGEQVLVREGLSSRISGSLADCSKAKEPGPQSAEMANFLKARDELLTGYSSSILPK